MTKSATDGQDLGPAIPIFDVDTIPEDVPWAMYQKRVPTKATKIDGQFAVVTSHGGDPVFCDDGWLAIDAEGYPYPIGAGEFRESYQPSAKNDPIPYPALNFTKLAGYIQEQSGGGTIGLHFSPERGEWSLMANFGEEEEGSPMVAGSALGIGTLQEAIDGAAGECGLLSE